MTLQTFDRESTDAVERVIQIGAEHYRREVMLPRLVNMPRRIYERDSDETADIVDALSDAIGKAERLGNADHWVYSQSRLLGLRQALRAETERLHREMAYLDECAGEGEV